MSRTLRKQMLTMTDLLNKANQTLKSCLKAGIIDENGIRQLLSDCKETGRSMENELKMVFRDDFKCAGELKEYYKSLCQMEHFLKNPVQRKKIMSGLIAREKELEQALDLQLPDKLEVVFLPYKSSLWPPMERLWNTAVADKSCDTYVVPVPYYECTSDGTFSAYHYEGADFPEHVPVTHYENYDIEKMWPDIVFIQNPYDQDHPEFSVDPRFYSDALKKRTEMLVCVPCLPPDTDLSDQQKVMEELTRFCTSMGVVNADRLVVPSEDIYQICLYILTENTGVETREYWKRKIRII
jgi:hypothetical protein